MAKKNNRGRPEMDETDSGLGNQALLTKIDKLRELNVGSLVPLPQVYPIAPLP